MNMTFLLTSTLRRYMRWLLLPLLVLGGLPGAFAASPEFSIPAPATAVKTQAVSLQLSNTSMGAPAQTKTFPIKDVQKVYGLAITGKIVLWDYPNSRQTFVRIVLIDDSTQQEYLVYQRNFSGIVPADYAAGRLADTDAVCYETCVLPAAINTFSLRVEVKEGSVDITELSYVDTPLTADAETLRREQNAVVIQNLNEKDLGWIAGETSVSNLTYAEKKRLVNLVDSNEEFDLQGFEYYRGGVFEVHSASSSTKSGSTRQSALVDSFDWTKRPPIIDPKTNELTNWVTPVQDQNPCGSCWAFASTGAVEAVTNLYFNQHLNLDLAEQDVLSCSGAGNCEEGGYVTKALDYFKVGVVAEDQFPYTATDQPCVNQPSKLIKISGTLPFQPKTEDEVKRIIIENGPITSGVNTSSMHHFMTLVGFEKDSSGRTVWIFKNSWGKGWGGPLNSKWGKYWQAGHGKNGYARVILELDNMYGTSAVVTPIISSNPSHQITCEDKDGDNYCNWGISKDKPSTCPASCKPVKDCDDSDAKKGPFDAKYNCPNINNEPDPQRPVASFKVLPAVKGEAPFAVTLDASASSDSDGKVVKYDWSQVRANTREKPTPIASNNNPTQTYTFDTAGQFEVILMVTDSQGLLAKDEAHNTVTVTGSQSQLIDLEAVEGKAFAWDNIGQPVKSGAILKGGISFNGGPYQKLVKFGDNLMGTLGHGGQAQSVIITGSITPDPKHACDKCADIFAFGEYFPYAEGKLGDNTCPPSKGKGDFYAMAKSYKNDRDNTQPRNYQLWDGKPATLPILYQGVTLKAGEAVEYILYEGPFDARGCLNIGFGYRVKVGNDYEIVYNHHAATVDNTMGATIRKK